MPKNKKAVVNRELDEDVTADLMKLYQKARIPKVLPKMKEIFEKKK